MTTSTRNSVTWPAFGEPYEIMKSLVMLGWDSRAYLLNTPTVSKRDRNP